MISPENLKFDVNGLIPAIITDDKSGKVLMMAYMSRESLEISIREGRACFWSRSRQELWRKGETSGNVQHIVSIKADCDSDTLLVRVNADGPACHTGAETCFNDCLYGEDDDGFSLDALYELVTDRKVNAKPGSYTTYLFEKGVDKILKKIGEESTEVVIAGKGGDRAETVFELADLCYHALVLMAELGITPDEVRSELKSRHVVDKKVKQEKMT